MIIYPDSWMDLVEWMACGLFRHFFCALSGKRSLQVHQIHQMESLNFPGLMSTVKRSSLNVHHDVMICDFFRWTFDFFFPRIATLGETPGPHWSARGLLLAKEPRGRVSRCPGRRDESPRWGDATKKWRQTRLSHLTDEVRITNWHAFRHSVW